MVGDMHPPSRSLLDEPAVPHFAPCFLEPNFVTRIWKLAEANYAQVKATHYEVAVLPLGATEPHNLHLPYATDVLEADTIGEKVCEAAHALGAKVVLLPTIPYGTETNQAAFPLAMNVNPSTLFAVVTDLVDSLVRHGIHKIVLLNSHGGNDLKPLLRELYGKSPARVFLCNWYQAVADASREIFTHPDDHAGEAETSLLLAYYPELVARHADGTLAADAGAVAPSRFEAVNRGWVNITRPWHLLTTNSGSGNPHEATAEKGTRLMGVIVDRVGGFLAELSESKLDERFPF
jgi:creatinine amidohydrolase